MNTEDIKSTEEYSVILLKSIAERHKNSDNFITDIHKKFFKTTRIKIRANLYLSIPFLFFLFGIVFFSYFLVGLFLMWREFSTIWFPGSGWILGIFIFEISFFFIIYAVTMHLNKWNWIIGATGFSIYFTLLLYLTFSFFLGDALPEWQFYGVEFTFYHYLILTSGTVWFPACIFFFVVYLSHIKITDFGGVHLCLGWIYTIASLPTSSKTNVSQNSESKKYMSRNDALTILTKSFHILIFELNNWLKDSHKLVFHNKKEIEESFYCNLVSDKTFLSTIVKRSRRKDFLYNILNKKLVWDILDIQMSKNDLKQKQFKKLDRKKQGSFFSEISLHVLPDIIQFIKDLSTKTDIKIEIFSGKRRVLKFIKQFKTQLISLVVFLITTIIPLFFTL